LVSDKFRKEEKQLKNILERYKKLVEENKNLDDKKIEEIQQNFESLFNFVAVGKVKVGKSSFLNALIGIKKGQEEVFKSAESIETSKITKLKKEC
jgi:ribosome biogenesis GTPase A